MTICPPTHTHCLCTHIPQRTSRSLPYTYTSPSESRWWIKYNAVPAKARGHGPGDVVQQQLEDYMADHAVSEACCKGLGLYGR
eukprot:NODE_2835_length_635_cov_106.622867_g2359_i0.p1 GENE.NODE_2835_length_635_cov_106.622867_g2359_i0~~NODE_2835_length_635_cov_106.622867_g2359_i0.p1  ORF type:complete len:83 (-),score=4.29 NODE_2835_length_635_cov_106.622867_g2359_i0:214-462(-)